MRYLDGDLAEDEDSILGSASDVLNRTVSIAACRGNSTSSHPYHKALPRHAITDPKS
jgi:hypothetical protein